jgi:hypothetical protein
MNESEKRFSFTSAASSTSGCAQKQIYQLRFHELAVDTDTEVTRRSLALFTAEAKCAVQEMPHFTR